MKPGEIHIDEMIYWSCQDGWVCGDGMEWVNWIATDANGDRYVYEEEPQPGDIPGEWDRQAQRFSKVTGVDVPKDWTKTKRRIVR